MAVLALLAFTSQSFAVVPCTGMADMVDMVDMADNNSHAVAPMMASHMAMVPAIHTQADESSAPAGPDCCSHKQCSQLECLSTSAAAVVGSHSPFAVQFSPTLSTEYCVACPLAVTSSLFRPPISR